LKNQASLPCLTGRVVGAVEFGIKSAPRTLLATGFT
jgi:hypothetical protein